MNNIKAIGIDLAKEIFYLHAVDERGSEVSKKKLSRKKIIEFMNSLDCDRARCVIGMEAYGGANYFAKKFRSLGYKSVRIVPAQFVKPYVKSHRCQNLQLNQQKRIRNEIRNQPNLKRNSANDLVSY